MIVACAVDTDVAQRSFDLDQRYSKRSLRLDRASRSNGSSCQRSPSALDRQIRHVGSRRILANRKMHDVIQAGSLNARRRLAAQHAASFLIQIKFS
jgi:hypothetical protein